MYTKILCVPMYVRLHLNINFYQNLLIRLGDIAYTKNANFHLNNLKRENSATDMPQNLYAMFFC